MTFLIQRLLKIAMKPIVKQVIKIVAVFIIAALKRR